MPDLINTVPDPDDKNRLVRSIQQIVTIVNSLVRRGDVVRTTTQGPFKIDFPPGGGGGGACCYDGETAISATATLAIDTAYVLTGSSYTVTLPDGTGNTGKKLRIRIAPGLTGLVTVEGNGAVTINGMLNRIMWASEIAELMWDGAEWVKLNGYTRPMYARMKRTTAYTTIADSTVTPIPTPTTVDDNTGQMTDNVNGRIDVVRAGYYLVVASVQYSALGASNITNVASVKNAATVLGSLGVSNGSNSYNSLICSTAASLIVGDYVRTSAYQESGGNASILHTEESTYVIVTEVPDW